MIKGKTIDEALKLTNKAVVEALDGLPPVKIHCSVLAEQAVKSALADYYRRHGVDPVSYTHLDVYKRQIVICVPVSTATKLA